MPRGVYIRTEEAKRNMSVAHFGQKPWNRGKKGLFKHTKESKLKVSRSLLGKRSRRWKGGKTKNRGYIFIWSPKHPFASTVPYVPEHRIVVEKQIGRYLLPSEPVHHLGKKDDNRPQMLMAFISHSVHLKFEKGSIVKPHEIIFDGRKLSL